MSRLLRRSAFTALVVLVAAVLPVAPVRAADPAVAAPEPAPDGEARLTVEPGRVDFDATHHSAPVMVTNHGPREVIVDVMPRVWAVGAVGARVLEESEQIFPFPNVLRVPAGATVKLNLVHTPPTGAEDVERQFEVALEGSERLADESWGRPVQARVDVRVMPRVVRVEPTFDPPKVAHGLLDLRLKNAGNVTFGARWLTFIATPLDGDPIEANVSGWFVVPGGHRDLRVALPKGMMCIRHLQIRVDTVAGTHHRADYPIDPASCDLTPLPDAPPATSISATARRRAPVAATR